MQKTHLSWFATAIGLVLLGLSSMALLSGCGKAVPLGNDEEVQELVIQIAHDNYGKFIVLPDVYEEINEIPFSDATLMGVKVDAETFWSHLLEFYPHGIYDEDKTIVEETLARAARLKLSIANIRVDEINKDVGKSRNSADLVANGKLYPVRFTAQHTADGDLYVEVWKMW